MRPPLPQDAPESVHGVLFTEEQIAERVAEIGRQIAADHAGEDLVLVGLLRGGIFFLADLCRRIDMPLTVDFMAVSSYGTAAHAGGVRITKDLDEDIRRRSVIVVEDLVDTGLTLNYLLGVLRARDPASLEIATLLDRDVRRIVDLPIAYRGFRMPDRFIVGYGLDLRGSHRNLRYVALLSDEVTL